MATINQNNIEFQNVKTLGLSLNSGPILRNGTNYEDDNVLGTINAVDIDWNEAQFTVGENTTSIDSTGKLLATLADQFNAIPETYATKQEIEEAGYITEVPEVDLTAYPTKQEIEDAGYITSADIPEVDLSAYATKQEIEDAGYITSADIPEVDLTAYPTKQEIEDAGYITSADIPEVDLTEYAKSADIESTYATKQEIAEANYIDETDLMSYASIEYVDNKLEQYQPVGDYLTTTDAEAEYAKISYVDEQTGTLVNSVNTLESDIQTIQYDLQNYASSESVESLNNTVQDIQTSLSDFATTQDIQNIIEGAPEEYNTLLEIANKLSEDSDTLGALTSTIAEKANADDVYSKQDIDDKITDIHNDISSLGDLYISDTEMSDALVQYTYSRNDIDGRIDDINSSIIAHEDTATATYATKEAVAALSDTVNGLDDVYQPKGEYLTEHQDLSEYATKEYVNDAVEAIVGTAPQNFDTLEELAAVMDDLKVVDTPAQEATYYEEGDELPEGVQVGDEKTPAVEEVSHNMTISEFVNETMQSVNEKPEIAALTKRLSDLEKFVNRYVTLTPEQQQTVTNDATVTETLANATSVTIEEGTIADIVVPETTKSTTITGELDPNSTLELTSPKGVTINNTGSEPTNLTVNAPANGSTPTVTLKSGVYDTVTVQDASLTVSNDATVQNVVITPETTKSTTINATFVEGATITSNSEAPITVTNKNAEGEEVSVTLNAPGSTVTLSGGKWTTISGEVSENTLIIKGSAKIQSLNLTKGNVIVEVPRDEDIHDVITGEITLGEGYTITHRTYDITNENSSKLGGIGEMILQEDITRTSSITAPLAPAYNAVWNLNGHNITVEGTPKYGVYLNRYTSNLEVVGTGVIHAEGSYGLWNAATTGKIIVNDGVTVEAQTHAIYAEKGTIEINGGTFKLTNADTAEKDANGNFKFLLNCYDANYTAGTANIIVKGGKFYGFNPAESYGELNGPVNFVAEGYESVPTNEAYEYGTVYEVKPITSLPTGIVI